MVEVDGNGRAGGARDDGVEIAQHAVVRDALVVERRQHERPGEAELGGVARDADRVADRGGAGADHHAVEGQPGLGDGRHRAHALLGRK
jgi:hypothetical protein